MSPRLARSQISTYTFFHICTRGNGNQTVFIDEKDFLRYLTLMGKYRNKYHLQYFAFCLMTNHIHLLLLSPSMSNLSKAIHDLHVAYVMYFNRRHRRNGHLFQDRFTSWVIRDEHHLCQAKEYIENNPVKAKIVTTKTNYKWSSASGDGSGVTLTQIRI